MPFDPVAALDRFVRHASVSADPAYASGMAGARQFLGQTLADLGFAVEEVPTPRHPVLLARRDGPASWPGVLIYGHYDVQPPDPLEKWTSAPFEPQIRQGRMYGRGAADNKGPLLAHVAAVARLLERHPDLPLRIAFVVEGEEEVGSTNYAGFLRAHKARLKHDFVFFSDTGNPSPDQVVITTGLRGLLAFEIALTGPASDLHSGLHGGVLHNPLQALSELLASLHKADGSINVPGFLADVRPVARWEREELQRLGLKEAAYRRQLGIRQFHHRKGITPFEAIRFHPTIEINGAWGGYTGPGPKTVIPAIARAKISCRLVPDQTPARIEKLLFRELRRRCPPGVVLSLHREHSAEPYVVLPPGRPNTPKDQSPRLAAAFQAVGAAVDEVFGRPPLFLREGGTVGAVESMKTILGLDSIMLGLFLAEDNLHAPDESFLLANLERGAAVSERVLARVAGLPG